MVEYIVTEITDIYNDYTLCVVSGSTVGISIEQIQWFSIIINKANNIISFVYYYTSLADTSTYTAVCPHSLMIALNALSLFTASLQNTVKVLPIAENTRFESPCFIICIIFSLLIIYDYHIIIFIVVVPYR